MDRSEWKYCADLEALLNKYSNAQSREDVYIKRTLENIAAQFEVCTPDQRYYADVITRDFCRIMELLLKQQAAKKACPEVGERDLRYRNGTELARAFYNHYKQAGQVDYMEISGALENGRKDLVNPTMKDYVARIYTFCGPKYLGEMFREQDLGDTDPLLFVYDHIEMILATFRTRDHQGQIVKQRVNIRSALRKLNEFKQRTQQ